jgi:hypothetical protein
VLLARANVGQGKITPFGHLGEEAVQIVSFANLLTAQRDDNVAFPEPRMVSRRARSDATYESANCRDTGVLFDLGCSVGDGSAELWLQKLHQPGLVETDNYLAIYGDHRHTLLA